MAMGIVDDKDFDKELERVETTIKHIDIIKGRGPTKAIPSIIREQIAEDLIDGATIPEVMDAYGISQASASAYKNGATSTATYNEPNESLTEANNKVRLEISSAARNRLRAALMHITEEKLASAKLRDIASVARDMSTIVNTMEPTASNGNNQGVQFVFNVPRQRAEKEYDVIELNG